MHKKELIETITKKSGLTMKDAEAALDGMLQSVEEGLKKKDKVTLVGFGKFEVRERKAVTPRTKREIKVPDTKLPAFKAGKALKDTACSIKTDKKKASRTGHEDELGKSHAEEE